MSIVVSLKEFVNEMDTFSSECRVFLNRDTGEFLGVTPEEMAAAEEGEEEEEEGDYDYEPELKEALPKIREALSSDSWLQLPSRYEINEYGIMEDFCANLADATLQGDLLDTIGGRGTFGRFKNMVYRHNLQDAWYKFRADALAEIAKDWLEGEGIAYGP